jgi:hypothetical protein
MFSEGLMLPAKVEEWFWDLKLGAVRSLRRLLASSGDIPEAGGQFALMMGLSALLNISGTAGQMKWHTETELARRQILLSPKLIYPVRVRQQLSLLPFDYFDLLWMLRDRHLDPPAREYIDWTSPVREGIS